MEANMCPERIKKRGWKKDVKNETQTRPKGVMAIIDGTNVGAQGPALELLAKANSDKKRSS